MQKIILASTSPYRKALLERLDLAFETAKPEIDESPLQGETAQTLVARLAEAKARAVAKDYPAAIIIGSDQVAVLDEHILGKPGNHQNAVRQLQEASGKCVIFHTGLCVFNTQTGKARVKVI